MAERRKKAAQPDSDGPPPLGIDQEGTCAGRLRLEGFDKLSTLQVLDLIASNLPKHRGALLDLESVRERLSNLEEVANQARQALEKFDEVVSKLRSPAFRVGTFLGLVEGDQPHVAIGATESVCRVDPRVVPRDLSKGQRVLCNEAFAAVGAFGFDAGGPIARVEELLPEARIRHCSRRRSENPGMNSYVE